MLLTHRGGLYFWTEQKTVAMTFLFYIKLLQFWVLPPIFTWQSFKVYFSMGHLILVGSCDSNIWYPIKTRGTCYLRSPATINISFIKTGDSSRLGIGHVNYYWQVSNRVIAQAPTYPTLIPSFKLKSGFAF